MFIKNALFDAEFESVKKVARRLVRKKLPAKKWPKNTHFFDYRILRAKVFALELLLSAFFCNEMVEKKKKSIFRIPFYIHFQSGSVVP